MVSASATHYILPTNNALTCDMPLHVQICMYRCVCSKFHDCPTDAVVTQTIKQKYTTEVVSISKFPLWAKSLVCGKKPWTSSISVTEAAPGAMAHTTTGLSRTGQKWGLTKDLKNSTLNRASCSWWCYARQAD